MSQQKLIFLQMSFQTLTNEKKKITIEMHFISHANQFKLREFYPEIQI